MSVPATPALSFQEEVPRLVVPVWTIPDSFSPATPTPVRDVCGQDVLVPGRDHRLAVPYGQLLQPPLKLFQNSREEGHVLVPS